MSDHQLVTLMVCDPSHATYVAKGAPSHVGIDGWTPGGHPHIAIKAVDHVVLDVYPERCMIHEG